jgi:hypothetical protein
MGPVIYKLICARVLGDVRRAWSFVLENTTNYDTAATCSNSPRCSQGGRSGCSSPCLVPQAPGALQVVIRAPARCHRGGRACLCVTGRSIRRSRKLFEESVPCYLTMLHFTLCMDMHGVTLVHIYIYIYIGVKDCPCGVCCPWVRGGWDLDALGKFFRRRRRRRRRPG